MSEKLLPLYEKELAFIQQSAGEFARRHPSVAGALHQAPIALSLI